MKDFNLKGHAAMLGANTMWGLMAPVAKMVMAAGIVSPLLMTNFRILGAALCLRAIFCLWPGRLCSGYFSIRAATCLESGSLLLARHL